MSMVPRRADAVVIGAGIGGLLAARALSAHFESVLVLDRDFLPDTPTNRKNIPQGHHLHVLLARGYEIISSLFPGIDAEMIASGAVPADSSRDLAWFQLGGYHQPPRTGLPALLLSRSLLEFHLRRRVEALPNVTIIDRCNVVGFTSTADRKRVNGVTLANAHDNSESEIDALLVVDSSGRGSRAAAWLAELGYPEMEVDLREANTHYATRRFRRTPSQQAARLASVVVASPDSPTGAGGVAVAQEGDTWVVTLSGRNETYPPTDLQQFTEYASRLDVPDVHQVVQQATPIDDAATYNFPVSQWRRFDRMQALPGGFLPFGDAICSFNPIYGQGMSVAAIEAEQLDRVLVDGMDRLSPRFFTSVLPAIGAAWGLVAGSDRPFSTTPVSLSPPDRFIDWYVGKLLIAAQRDAVVSDAFHRVADMVDLPPRLLRPAIASRVALAHFRPVGRTGESRLLPWRSTLSPSDHHTT
jgi:2-polyprenyl-6-methoxyphenol hydroxylase-like FAD-dependent oxidoreductase